MARIARLRGSNGNVVGEGPGFEDGVMYEVKPADRLFGIARKFGVTATRIILENPGNPASRLEPGTMLWIPGASQDHDDSQEAEDVDAIPTDHAAEHDRDQRVPPLRGAQGTSPSSALPAHGLASKETETQTRPKEVSSAMACPDGLFYAVRRGETCSAIARKFAVSVAELEAANPGLDCQRLQIGQLMCIPGVQPDICPNGQLYTVRRGDSMYSIAERFNITLSKLVEANWWIPDPELIYPGEQLCVPEAMQPPVTDCRGGLKYAARQGETCSSIARKFGVTVNELQRANPLLDCDELRFGDVLCIPGVASELCSGGRLYTVKTGDTMYSISQRTGIPLNTLIAANDWIPDPNVIYPGEQLCIPEGVIPPTSCKGGLLYAVRRGETFFSIARKFGVSVEALSAANPSVDPDELSIGQVICIPGVADEVCPDGMLYTVKPGESMFTIARKFGLPVDELIEANMWIPDPAVVYPGEQLCIPEEAPPMPVDCEDGILYGIRPGENFFRLSQRFGVPVQELIEANPQADPNNLQVGQIVCIPEVGEELCPAGDLYTVERGESVFSIAAEFSIPVDELVEANEWIPNPNVIYPGEQLCIPAEEPPMPMNCSGGLLYGVRSGESFFTMSQKFGVTVSALVEANPEADPNNLQIGQIVCIPGVAKELCPDGMLYTVMRGESFFSISEKFCVDLDDLVEANDWIPDPSLIFPGEQLCIPEK